MTEEKPTPEAMAVALASDPNKYAPSQHIPFARALDACIEAALRRREDALESTQAELRSACIAHCAERGALYAELESLRKPLEGELAEDVERVAEAMAWKKTGTEYIRACHSLDRIALRAKVEPQAACEACANRSDIDRRIDALAARVLRGTPEEKGEPQAAEPPVLPYELAHPDADCNPMGYQPQFAAEPPEPRPIVGGSWWENTKSGALHEVTGAGKHVWTVGGANWQHEEFRRAHKWLRDPEPAAPAPELPCKVEPGTTLTVGARYRITAISTDDNCPCNQVGDKVTGYPDDHRMPVGTVFVNWDSDGYWFAKGSGPSGGTYVTGLELVADAPKESK